MKGRPLIETLVLFAVATLATGPRRRRLRVSSSED